MFWPKTTEISWACMCAVWSGPMPNDFASLFKFQSLSRNRIYKGHQTWCPVELPWWYTVIWTNTGLSIKRDTYIETGKMAFAHIRLRSWTIMHIQVISVILGQTFSFQYRQSQIKIYIKAIILIVPVIKNTQKYRHFRNLMHMNFRLFCNYNFIFNLNDGLYWNQNVLAENSWHKLSVHVRSLSWVPVYI